MHPWSTLSACTRVRCRHMALMWLFARIWLTSHTTIIFDLPSWWLCLLSNNEGHSWGLFYIFATLFVGGFCIFIITWPRLIKNLVPLRGKECGPNCGKCSLTRAWRPWHTIALQIVFLKLSTFHECSRSMPVWLATCKNLTTSSWLWMGLSILARACPSILLLLFWWGRGLPLRIPWG